MVARRARSIAGMVVASANGRPPWEPGLGLDPPLDHEMTRLRHLRILAGRMPPQCQCSCESCQYRVHLDHDTPRLRQQRFAEDCAAAATDVQLITMAHEDDMALWAIPAVWVYISREEEYLNTVIAVITNILNRVLDRRGVPFEDDEGPLMVD